MKECCWCMDRLARERSEFCGVCWQRIPSHMRANIERGQFRANLQALNYLREQARARAEGHRRPGRAW